MQTCHDCKQQLRAGDKAMEYKQGLYFKCIDCYEKESLLTDYQETEVYSRVVGFLRPVSQWNKGKAQEFKDRAEYAL